MNIRTLFKNRKLFLKYILLIFGVASIVFITEYTLFQRNALINRRDEIIRNEEKVIGLQSLSLDDQLQNVLSDITIMTKMDSSKELDYEEVKNNWIVFLDAKKIYDEVSITDLSGNEKLSIKYGEEGSFEGDAAENKAGNLDFQKALELEPEQIHISKLKLGSEDLKPTIIFSKLLFDSSGEKKGVVTLTYTGENILDRFYLIASASRGSFYLVNSSGHWISRMEGEGRVEPLKEESVDNSFKDLYPEVWNKIVNSERGELYDREKGFFIFERSRDLIEKDEDGVEAVYSGENFWYIISFISKDTEDGNILQENWKSIIIESLKNERAIFFLLFLLSLLISLLTMINRISREKVKFFSEYDEMTKTLNRRAGILKLGETFKECTEKAPLSICFLDINGLKEVNDNLGHDKGDELITTFTRIMRKFIRKSDFVSRLGGDEFLIIFPDADKIQAEKIWERIDEECWRINEKEGREYRISVSHGISCTEDEEYESIDGFIRTADEKMYEEKRVLKKEIEIIKSEKKVE